MGEWGRRGLNNFLGTLKGGWINTYIKGVYRGDMERGRPYPFDEERQVTKPTSPLQSCRQRTGFRHSRSRSRAVAYTIV